VVLHQCKAHVSLFSSLEKRVRLTLRLDGPPSGAGQAYGGNQPQQQGKGGFVNTAKTLYKDYKKEKSGGGQDNQGRGSMGN
jgi:hypothetical protein